MPELALAVRRPDGVRGLGLPRGWPLAVGAHGGVCALAFSRRVGTARPRCAAPAGRGPADTRVRGQAESGADPSAGEPVWLPTGCFHLL